ncbi:MAG: tRNA pseudouridine(55) synthase TruB, partial [bacterium]
HFLHMDKAYRVDGVLGMKTDTFDVNGRVIKKDHSAVTREQLQATLEDFKGQVWQVPPPYSAKKIAGRKAYELARRGLSVDMPAREVNVYAIELVAFRYPQFALMCVVSSGFYVRSLVHDVGVELGVGAAVVDVRRTRVGSYGIDQARPLHELLGS